MTRKSCGSPVPSGAIDCSCQRLRRTIHRIGAPRVSRSRHHIQRGGTAAADGSLFVCITNDRGLTSRSTRTRRFLDQSCHRMGAASLRSRRSAVCITVTNDAPPDPTHLTLLALDASRHSPSGVIFLVPHRHDCRPKGRPSPQSTTHLSFQ